MACILVFKPWEKMVSAPFSYFPPSHSSHFWLPPGQEMKSASNLWTGRFCSGVQLTDPLLSRRGKETLAYWNKIAGRTYVRDSFLPAKIFHFCTVKVGGKRGVCVAVVGIGTNLKPGAIRIYCGTVVKGGASSLPAKKREREKGRRMSTQAGFDR